MRIELQNGDLALGGGYATLVVDCKLDSEHVAFTIQRLPDEKYLSLEGWVRQPIKLGALAVVEFEGGGASLTIGPDLVDQIEEFTLIRLSFVNGPSGDVRWHGVMVSTRPRGCEIPSRPPGKRTDNHGAPGWAAGGQGPAPEAPPFGGAGPVVPPPVPPREAEPQEPPPDLPTEPRTRRYVRLLRAVAWACGSILLFAMSLAASLALLELIAPGQGERGFETLLGLVHVGASPARSPASAGAATPRETVAAEESSAGAVCDRLAGFPYDSDRNVAVPGARNQCNIDWQKAILRCSAAAKAEPGTRRFKTQLGRALIAKAQEAAVNGETSVANDAAQAAVQEWIAAAEAGSGCALNFLGAYYKGHYGQLCGGGMFTFVNTPDRAKAHQYWKQASDLRDVAGMHNFGTVLANDGLPGDIEQGRRLWIEAAKAGYTRAYFSIGEARLTGAYLFERDAVGGLACITQAYCGGDSEAQRWFANPPAAFRRISPPDCADSPAPCALPR